jgi:hypothetical protein
MQSDLTVPGFGSLLANPILRGGRLRLAGLRIQVLDMLVEEAAFLGRGLGRPHCYNTLSATVLSFSSFALRHQHQ